MKRKTHSGVEISNALTSNGPKNGAPIKYKNLRKTIAETVAVQRETIAANTATQILLPSSAGGIEVEDKEMEKTFKLTQNAMRNESMVDLNTARNFFDLQLRFGPYKVDYSRNGRFMLMGGKKGHVAIMDCLRTSVGAELQLREEVHDLKYLHNDTLFATAQKKYMYVYSNYLK